MADADTIRRREIRKRKILEQSEARLNRITNAKILDPLSASVKEDNSRTKSVEDADSHLLPNHEASEVVNTNSLNLETVRNRFDNNSRNRINDDKAADIFSSNGSSQRSPATDCYIFPKKVSDAETRSFVRSRSDARRNSTCTQMMMETFPFSSFTFSLLRPWIAAVLSFALVGYLFFSGNVLFFQTLLLPYLLLEVAFYSWTKFESQTNSRQVTSSFISGVFILCGIPLHIVTTFNSVLYFMKSAVQDLVVYVFSFVFFHFICETYM